MDDRIIIFTDGSSRGNPGPGGWAAILHWTRENRVLECAGAENPTTNNRMEITAAIEALDAIGKAGGTPPITINTDSRYLINGITKWVAGWQKKNWKTTAKEDVQNRDLWERLVEVTAGKEIDWHYVAGHVGTAGNERADTLATDFADKKGGKLYDGPKSAYSYSLDATVVGTKEKTKKNKNTFTAYSYVSSVAGKIEIHKTWAVCEARVKGASGARFKKSKDKADEEKIIAEFTKR